VTQKTLFILKRREDYNAEQHSQHGLSTGLYNSATFVKDMLVESGHSAVLEVAIDNNCIDRLVTLHRPTHVIIEALWVVPSKFSVLTKLHPNVKWIVRLHSEMPFMAGEGMAMDWVGDYLTYPSLFVGVNAPRMLNEIRTYIKMLGHSADRAIYMPNFYPQAFQEADWTSYFEKQELDSYVDVGCFGAVRLLKNHLVQAFGAIKFAEKERKKLRFHINSGRVEMQGQPVVHNLEGLFSHISDSGHQLINHEWTPREDFLKICGAMDLGLQVSFSETFNIVGADIVSQNVPIVGSSEIPWLSWFSSTDPTNSDAIAKALSRAYRNPKFNIWRNQSKLISYTSDTRKVWDTYLKAQNES
jgi:hypothetical protein